MPGREEERIDNIFTTRYHPRYETYPGKDAKIEFEVSVREEVWPEVANAIQEFLASLGLRQS